MFKLPYTSDHLSMILIMISAGVLLFIPTTYFGGKIGVTIAFLALTVFSCFIFLYAKGLGKSFSNSNAPKAGNAELLLPFLAFATFYAFMAYGSFCLSQVAHGVEGYKVQLTIWILILVGYPLFSYSRQVYSLYNTQIKHYSSKIIIAHPRDFPIQFDQIRFLNSKTKKASYPYYDFREDYDQVEKTEGITCQNIDMQSQRYYTQLSPLLIPIRFDSFELSWYSILENKFYKDTFPLDQNKLTVRQKYDGQMTISNMLIHILPNGNVDLLKNDHSERTHIIPYFDIAFTSVKGKSLDAIWKLFTPTRFPETKIENLKKSFDKLQKGTGTQFIPEEILSFRSVHTYGIDIKITQKSNEINELKEIKIIDFYLNKYLRKADFLRKINKKPLPSFFEIKILNNKDKRRWIDVVFDKKALLNQYTSFIALRKDDISFEVTVDIEDLEKSQICLKSKDEKLSLHSWRITED